MNMSYCMFENTSIDMRQLLQAMDEAGNVKDLDLSRTETRAYQELYQQCEAFMQLADRLEEGESNADYDEEGNEDCGLETCRD